MTAPVRVRPSPAPFARAIPKSATLTSPDGVMRTLPGLMSRWMTPRRCAVARARAMSLAIPAASAGAIGPAAMDSRSVLPSTYSMTMKEVSCSWPQS